MSWLGGVIGRPEHAHRVKSEAEYRQCAKAFLLRSGLKPVLEERQGDEQPVAYVSDGRWVCDCDCGNGPSASPEWGVAICLECGVVHRPVFPRAAELAEVEALLLVRARAQDRNFRPHEGETVAHLRAEAASAEGEGRRRGGRLPG